jgi:hypothetical protein
MAGSNSFSLTILLQRFNALNRIKTAGSHWNGSSNLKKLGDGKE